MKTKYTLFRRGAMFYMQDSATGKQTSLRTKDEAEANSLLNARNAAQQQPTLNLHLARAYRYAWAERAKVVGMPERFAQAALGHNSKAIHRAYAKKAIIIAPSLEDYEAKAAQQKLVAA